MLSLSAGPRDDWYRTDRAADPADTLTFLERVTRDAQLHGQELAGEWQGPMRPGLSALYDAAERQTRLVDASSARRAALEDFFSRTAAEVRRVTGEVLPNPALRNTTELAGRIGRGEFTGWQDPRLEELIAGRQDAFLARVAELKAQYGDRLNVDPWTPVQAQARANAAQAEADFKREWERTDLPLAGQLVAMFAGAMVGSREDPLFWLSLPFGGPGKNAAGPVARIATSALSNAAANAAFAAVAQPTVQAWRREIGVEAGLGEAVKNVGMAFGIGAVAGGGLTAAGELLRGLSGRGSANRAIKAIEEAGGFVDDDTRAALRAAEMAGEADDATRRVPAGVHDADAIQGLVDGARAAVEVDAPLPMGSRPVRPGVTDALARDILDNEADPVAALQRLRESPDAIESAIASDLPDVRAAGYAATLGDAAFARIASGEVDPIAGSIIARMTDSEPHQAGLLARIAEAGARTEDDIRQVASDAVRIMVAREAAAAQMGVAPELLLTPAEMAGRRAALRRTFGAELLDRVGALENSLGAARNRLGELLAARQTVMDAAQAVAAPRLAALRAELAGITGKRRSSPRAQALRDAIADLETGRASIGDSTAQRLEGDIALLRQRVAALDMERRRLGPEMSALEARVAAELEPFAARDLPFVFGDPDWLNNPAWRRADDVMRRDGLTVREVALERAVLEETMADPVARRIVSDVAGGEFPTDRKAAPGDRQAAAGGPDAGSAEGGEAGPGARAGGGGDDGLAAARQDAGPADLRRADASDVKNQVPLIDDRGNATTIDRAALDTVGERQRLLADVVSACKV